MEKGFAIKGSNTLFKVWGIIIFVLAGIGGFFEIIGIIGVSVGASMLSELTRMAGEYFDLSGYLVVIVIIVIISAVIGLSVQILTGIVLVRDYVKTKWVLIALAVFWFVSSLISLPFIFYGAMIFSLINKSGMVALCIISGLLGMAWNVATGVLLIVKQNRAISCGSKSYGGSGNGNELDYSQPYAIIEGANGVFRGKRYRLEIGHLCRIGRDSTCDIQINHPQISHEHCTIVLLSNGKLSITDYSKNGTFYKDIQLPTGVAYDVNPGGWLALGGTDNVFSLKVYQ
ncbi:MAG: FHA domain-containing protein [Lachnospiraceae bacterium]